VSLRDELAKKTGTAPKLRIGKPGSLDVIVDGRTVYSKEKSGRMPTADEVMALVKGAS
jgi:hypothetical protein